MSMGDDISEKTSIISGETSSGSLKQAEQTPAAFVVQIGPQGYVGKFFSLTKNEYIIGRNPESSIFIDDKSISRSHAHVMIIGGEVTIQDLGSSNKTSINNMALIPMSPHRLKNNDQVKCGNVILKYYTPGSLEAALNKQLNEKSERDALTGAFNRGALLEKGPDAIKRAEFLKESLSVIVFDVDFFKKINDSHGHPGGDYVLKELGRIVSAKLIRPNDYFARYGGEEFVLILAGTPQKNAEEVAERVRNTIQYSEFVFDGNKINVTISLGVVTRKDEAQWEPLFDKADRALYQSKQTGRNKVTVAT